MCVCAGIGTYIIATIFLLAQVSLDIDCKGHGNPELIKFLKFILNVLKVRCESLQLIDLQHHAGHHALLQISPVADRHLIPW